MEHQIFLGLLQTAIKNKASDIHLAACQPPYLRIRADLVSLKMAPLTENDMVQIASWLLLDKKNQIDTFKDYDGSFEIKKLGRFRVNLFRHQGKIGAVLRVIHLEVPSIESLELPKVLYSIAQMPQGLILVTGATGSGKSSTLAAMLNYLNYHASLHIVTIEDPIEFIHTPQKARFTQREVGKDTQSFSDALRAALRQDPDVILLGEMRDTETVEIALKAAETGHTVFSTVHTTDAVKTIGRLVAMFDPKEQKMARLRLSDNLKAVISQRLVSRVNQAGMVAAQEIMINNAAIAECIANPELTGTMSDYIAKSYGVLGGQTFEQHLVQLYISGVISFEAAKEASSNPTDFERNLTFGKNAQKVAQNADSKIILQTD